MWNGTKWWDYQGVMQCLLPWAEVVMHACITCEQPDGAGSTFSLNHKFHAVSRVRKKTGPASIQGFHWTLKNDFQLAEQVCSTCTLRVGEGWASSSRSFSLPCFRLAHILCQPSAPIHPLDQILPGSKDVQIQHAFPRHHQYMTLTCSTPEHLVKSPFCYSPTRWPLPNSFYGW